MLGQVTPADPAGSGLRRVGVLTHLGRPEAIDTAVRLIEGLAVSGIRCAVPADDLDVLTKRVSAADVEPMQPSDVAETGTSSS